MNNRLYEFISHDRAQIVLESSKDGKNMFMSGIFIQGEVQNQNKRVYPLEQIRRAVGSVVERITEGETILGELDHPEELSINLDRVSHIIESMWMENSDGHGKLKIIGTPMGNIVRTLLESGAKLGVSSRGSGNVDTGGQVSEFDIVTVDIVATPSAPNAYPRTIYESLFNMRGGPRVYETSAQYTHGNDVTAQKYLEKDILQFIRELRKM